MNRAERRRASRNTSPARRVRQPVTAELPPLPRELDGPDLPPVQADLLDGRGHEVDHAVRLRRLAARRADLERELQDAIALAARDGMSLAAIGRVVGMARQSVWQRVHGAP
jgi:DNA-directed RNA polymerase specialized sigma24 family protein